MKKGFTPAELREMAVAKEREANAEREACVQRSLDFFWSQFGNKVESAAKRGFFHVDLPDHAFRGHPHLIPALRSFGFQVHPLPTSAYRLEWK